MPTIHFTIPHLIKDIIEEPSFYTTYNARGTPTGYCVDIELKKLKLIKQIKSKDLYILESKLDATLSQWAEKYQRYLDMEHKERRASNVDEMNAEAKSNIDALKNILNHTLEVNDAVSWEDIKRNDPFVIHPKDIFEKISLPDFIEFEKSGKPLRYSKIAHPKEPTIEEVRSKYGLLTKLLFKKTIIDDFDNRCLLWKKSVFDSKNINDQRLEIFNKYVDKYAESKLVYEEEQKISNSAIDDMKSRYNAQDDSTVIEYCDLVLSASQYPNFITRNWDMEYIKDVKMVIIEMELPLPEAIPENESFKYVKSSDEIVGKKLPDSTRSKLYDNLIYQICLRTMHELFEADVIQAIASIVFNGVVSSRNKATGRMESKVIISVSADKEKFMQIDLGNVDPRATFKHLKGVSASALYELTPIPPIITFEKNDRRIIEGRVVDVDESTNLASMQWDDFEHLIRELFEKEFSSNGGEVKITQASSDGGVDAIAYDPDPIRGGKIVIQAKRYNNVVGVEAVRDLYGTVMNEGATKGILVTTSNYGKDSFEFAKNKPLTLISGGNLLALLEKHGYKARIELKRGF